MTTVNFSYEEISKMIDHSLLNPSFAVSELERGCLIARQYSVASVCIMPFYLRRCAEILDESAVNPSTTIGFPHGGHTTKIKVAEAVQSIEDGADELDMVVNISRVLSDDW